jgi:hypothetical protein
MTNAPFRTSFRLDGACETLIANTDKNGKAEIGKRVCKGCQEIQQPNTEIEYALPEVIVARIYVSLCTHIIDADAFIIEHTY